MLTSLIPALSTQLSLVTRKLVFGVCDQGRLMPIRNSQNCICFFWLSLPGHNRVTDEALLVENT